MCELQRDVRAQLFGGDRSTSTTYSSTTARASASSRTASPSSVVFAQSALVVQPAERADGVVHRLAGDEARTPEPHAVPGDEPAYLAGCRPPTRMRLAGDAFAFIASSSNSVSCSPAGPRGARSASSTACGSARRALRRRRPRAVVSSLRCRRPRRRPGCAGDPPADLDPVDEVGLVASASSSVARPASRIVTRPSGELYASRSARPRTSR